MLALAENVYVILPPPLQETNTLAYYRNKSFIADCKKKQMVKVAWNAFFVTLYISSEQPVK
jgi:hypothetical protein